MAWLMHCDACGKAEGQDEPVGWMFVQVVQEAAEPEVHPMFAALGVTQIAARQKRAWAFCSPKCLLAFAALEAQEES